jgi:hypothetical protein
MSSFGKTARQIRNRRRIQNSNQTRNRRDRNRRLLVEQFEDRVMLAGDIHGISAANLDVVQNDTGNTAASVTVTLPYAINDFQLLDGSNRGDYNVQLGDDSRDDQTTAVLITSVRELVRDNGEGSEPYATSSIAWWPDGGTENGPHAFIPIHNAPGGGEYNINVAAGFFPYEDGWYGGWALNETNGGALTTFYGHPDLQLGTHFLDESEGGQSTVDLSSLGINSQSDGILLVNGGKNEDNFALTRANENGTWTIFNHDNGANAGSYEQDPVAFVFVPITNTDVVSGRLLGDGSTELTSQTVNGTSNGDGTYHLSIPGYSPLDGVLLISPEGGNNLNVDNIVNYEISGDGWDIETRDLTGMGLQNVAGSEPVMSFVFIPGPDRIAADVTSGLITTESGAQATFSVTLDRPPTADVTVPITSSDPGEGTTDVTELLFTAADWNIPQVVTITGADDTDTDGEVAYTIELGAATSADPVFDGYDAADVSVTNYDDEVTRSVVIPTADLVTTEAGGEASFMVFLTAATAPTTPIYVELVSSDETEGLVESLTFETADWYQPQIATITGVDDDVDDGDIAYTIVTSTASVDPPFSGLPTADVSVTNLDDDTAGILVDPTSGLETTEEGGTAAFSVVLTSEPTADVVIDVVSSDTTEGVVSADTLTFTADNWDTTQIVTIIGQADGVADGDIDYEILLTVAEGDGLYSAMDPDDVSVTNLGIDTPTEIILDEAELYYGVGDPAFAIAHYAMISDEGQDNYDTGNLTVTVTNPDPGDLLAVRNQGVENDQIGVDGTDVTYEGVVIGTWAGGDGANPLVITLNDQATVEATEALMRNVTYSNTSDNPSRIARVVEFVIDDGDGGISNSAFKTINYVVVRMAEFQEGVDFGYGTYVGQVDVELRENDPDTVRTTGDANGLLVDYDATGVASNVLMRFDGLIGDQPGQIPEGATIISATLTVDTNNPGDGGTFHRMLIPWDAEAETWNTMVGGIQANNVEARAAKDSEVGTVDGSGSTGTGSIEIGVTRDIQAWANGEVNLGWAILGWPDNTDGWAFSPGEATNPDDRPKLTVKWVPGETESTNFVDTSAFGDSGVSMDASIEQDSPGVPSPFQVALFTDAPDTSNGEVQALLKFQNIFGGGASQIPVGAKIHSAQLLLASTVGDAMGDGGTAHAMLQNWVDEFVSWSSFGSDGLTANDIEAIAEPSFEIGNSSLAPDAQAGYHWFDVTTDLQAWASQERANYGWAFIPWDGGTNGWGFASTDAVQGQRPELIVYYSTPGITVQPTSGLITSELGHTAEFTIQLESEPSADVTIDLSTSDDTEGTPSPASVTFTPDNWNMPQTITVTGVDDADVDGLVDYQILTAAASSTDVGYDGLDAADVDLSNMDDESPGVFIKPLFGLETTEDGDAAHFEVSLLMAPTDDVTIPIASDDETEGVADETSLTFTTDDWAAPQTVTVTGQPDYIVDGDVAYNVVTGDPTSADAGYDALTAEDVWDVALVNLDVDAIGVTVDPMEGLVTTEDGGTDSFTVVLDTIPSDTVVIDVVSSDTTEGTVSVAQLSFDDTNWNVPQEVTVTGEDDAEDDQNVEYSIQLTINQGTTGDTDYLLVASQSVAVVNIDNENVAAVVSLPGTPIVHGFGSTDTLLYGIGTSGKAVDAFGTVVDTDPDNYDTGTLTVTLTENGTADDRLVIRNDGSEEGQVGVSGSDVTYGGVVVGAVAGGVGTDPLVVTFNAEATPEIVQAVLRGVTFSNVSATPDTTPRTVEVVVTDNYADASVPVTKTIQLGVLQSASYQYGVDAGYGAYMGAADIQLAEFDPNNALPAGGDGNGLLVDYDGSGVASQVLLRFDELIGEGAGQIPVGSRSWRRCWCWIPTTRVTVARCIGC